MQYPILPVRTVLDTDVLVAALRSESGASRQLVLADLEHRYALLLSVPLILEYEAVLTRPEQLQASGISARDVEILLDALVSVSVPVEFSFRWRLVLPDPHDDMVLETAVNGAADLLVTFNQRHFREALKTFEPQLATPGDALQRLRLI